MNSSNHTDVLLEDMSAKFDAVLELVSPLASLPAKVDALANDVAELKSDVKVIKAAVTDQSRQINGHEQRLTMLETA